jgi:hypothetical protein
MCGFDHQLAKSLIESLQQIPGVFVVHAELQAAAEMEPVPCTALSRSTLA